MNLKNVVIGFYSHYSSLDTDKGGLRIFVETFRKYNQKDIIIVCAVPPINCDELKPFCDKNNCIIEMVILDDVKTGNRWKNYYDILKNKIYKDNFEIDNILIIDMNDAMFQDDPFSIKLDDKLYCAGEKTIFEIFPDNAAKNNYNSLNINTTWMNQTGLITPINNNNLMENSIKTNIEESIFRKPILCSGTILGSYNSIINVLKWSLDKIGADQGLLNIYCYSVLSNNEYIVHDVDYSSILTLDSIEFKTLNKDKNGFILNKNGNKYAICHQIDRGCHLDHYINIWKNN